MQVSMMQPRGDTNLDGIEDLEICMVTRSKTGTCNTKQRVSLQKLTRDTPLIAMAVGHRSSHGDATGSEAAC